MSFTYRVGMFLGFIYLYIHIFIISIKAYFTKKEDGEKGGQDAVIAVINSLSLEIENMTNVILGNSNSVLPPELHTPLIHVTKPSIPIVEDIPVVSDIIIEPIQEIPEIKNIVTKPIVVTPRPNVTRHDIVEYIEMKPTVEIPRYESIKPITKDMSLREMLEERNKRVAMAKSASNDMMNVLAVISTMSNDLSAITQQPDYNPDEVIKKKDISRKAKKKEKKKNS